MDQPKVTALHPGTPKWAEVIAIRLVATKYASEVEAIKTELMFAYAQGYQDAKREELDKFEELLKDVGRVSPVSEGE